MIQMKLLCLLQENGGCEWNEGNDFQSVDVESCDVVSFPPGCARRFMNITENEPDTDHVLLLL